MARKFLGPRGTRIAWYKLGKIGIDPMSITYGDALLVPQPDTALESRKSIDLSTRFGPYSLKIPVISAPMDTVSGEKMIRKLASLGAIGSLPRHKDSFGKNLTICERLSEEKIPCLYAVGIRDAVNEAKQLKERGAQMVLLDIAHGGMRLAQKTAVKLKELGLYVVVGNIATYEQAKWYKDNGIDYARVGVGPGGVCTTRLVAGSGVPQLSAVMDTSETGIYVIADGGIQHPGDVAKAIAAGARMVMVGSKFGGTDESPGEVINGKKILRGQASASYMKDSSVEVGEYRAAEGIATEVPAKGSVDKIIYALAGGLRSAMSYSGAKNIDSFQKNAVFVTVSPASAEENRPHAQNGNGAK